jgi:putative CocE/NonD family hydrolase
MVIQDCRGRSDSKGIWEPFRYDAEDGFDTQEWIGKQVWCNGKIGTSGRSYNGWTQWSSAAELKHALPILPKAENDAGKTDQSPFEKKGVP